ncbi:NAD(P)H oxidoreductase [Pedobacter yulinensis]|uniref:NAD(P)H oxidoreductase n=1 Tax=Pedobacter yulinensis TaxID=2126353 RepID=A0A2T3HPI5_9SPHI|nr:NAD(P)H-dependent oxidoreductase [Pedobacter yulinensis]PST84317.1 NAD(P)H oxidoreductase [Pedobacter yulinensis]
MKTLVIIIHPDLAQSVVNKRWILELQKHPEKYTLHNLYLCYPDGQIDVAAEQEFIARYAKIVFQFPFYWFSCPPLFKQWLDEVLTDGWSYGSNYALRGKKVALAISAGIDAAGYQPGGRYKYTLEQLTAPFELTFAYVRADYRQLFAFYGREYNGTAPRIEESARAYLDFIDAL